MTSPRPAVRLLLEDGTVLVEGVAPPERGWRTELDMHWRDATSAAWQQRLWAHIIWGEMFPQEEIDAWVDEAQRSASPGRPEGQPEE